MRLTCRDDARAETTQLMAIRRGSIIGDALATHVGSPAVAATTFCAGAPGNDEIVSAMPLTCDGTSRGGNDHLYSGTGDDRLYGDGRRAPGARGGADVFHFAGSFGADQILDYRTAGTRSCSRII